MRKEVLKYEKKLGTILNCLSLFVIGTLLLRQDLIVLFLSSVHIYLGVYFNTEIRSHLNIYKSNRNGESYWIGTNYNLLTNDCMHSFVMFLVALTKTMLKAESGLTIDILQLVLIMIPLACFFLTLGMKAHWHGTFEALGVKPKTYVGGYK